MNMDVWVVGSSNQLFVRGSYTEIFMLEIFWKNKVVTGKTSFFVIGPFCTTHFICLNMASDRVVLFRNVFILSTFN